MEAPTVDRFLPATGITACLKRRVDLQQHVSLMSISYFEMLLLDWSTLSANDHVI
jgi:hypothetical protein